MVSTGGKIGKGTESSQGGHNHAHRYTISLDLARRDISTSNYDPGNRSGKIGNTAQPSHLPSIPGVNAPGHTSGNMSGKKIGSKNGNDSGNAVRLVSRSTAFSGHDYSHDSGHDSGNPLAPLPLPWQGRG